MRARLSVILVGLLVVASPLGLAAAKSSSKAISTAKVLRKAKWASNVSVSVRGGVMTWRSNGIPNAGVLGEYAVPDGAAGMANPNASNSRAAASSQVVRSQNYDFSITTSPRKLKKTTPAPLGAIGVMISGAVLFNPYEADNTTAALAANFTVKDSGGNDVPFIDPCNGHPNPMGQYHYHGLPACVTSQVDTANGPSHIIGVAFDGFPIYGDRNIKGKQVQASQLDACNGITSRTPEFPHGIYHYVLLNVKSSRSSLNCLHGKFTRATAAAVSRQVSYCWVGRSRKR